MQEFCLVSKMDYCLPSVPETEQVVDDSSSLAITHFTKGSTVRTYQWVGFETSWEFDVQPFLVTEPRQRAGDKRQRLLLSNMPVGSMTSHQHHLQLVFSNS